MFINITLMLCTPASQGLMYPIFALHYDKLVNEVYGPDLPSEKFQNRRVCSQAVRIGHCRKRSTHALDRATKYKISIN